MPSRAPLGFDRSGQAGTGREVRQCRRFGSQNPEGFYRHAGGAKVRRTHCGDEQAIAKNAARKYDGLARLPASKLLASPCALDYPSIVPRLREDAHAGTETMDRVAAFMER